MGRREEALRQSAKTVHGTHRQAHTHTLSLSLFLCRARVCGRACARVVSSVRVRATSLARFCRGSWGGGSTVRWSLCATAPPGSSSFPRGTRCYKRARAEPRLIRSISFHLFVYFKCTPITVSILNFAPPPKERGSTAVPPFMREKSLYPKMWGTTRQLEMKRFLLRLLQVPPRRRISPGVQ